MAEQVVAPAESAPVASAQAPVVVEEGSGAAVADLEVEVLRAGLSGKNKSGGAEAAQVAASAPGASAGAACGCRPSSRRRWSNPLPSPE